MPPRRGSYYLLDISAEPAPCHTLFQLPGPKGKGVLVAPTVHGNTLVGPTAVDVDDPEATCTSAAELAAIAQLAHQSFPKLDLKATITSFAGLRAHEAGHEFVVREVAPGYVHAAGIDSPGLTASAAIALIMKELLGNQLHYIANKQAGRTRKGPVKTRELSVEQLALLVESDPAYGIATPVANAVAEIRTELAPEVLLGHLLAIEDALGRTRVPGEEGHGPRTIDCDLVFMEGETHGGSRLRLPHPGLTERDFVLVPMEDLVRDPARYLRHAGVTVKPREERVGIVRAQLGPIEW